MSVCYGARTSWKQTEYLQWLIPGGQTMSDTYRLDLAFTILCCYVSAFTWVLFDYTLTLHDEVMYIWKRPLQAGTFLFYSLRLLGVASLAAGIGIYLWPEHTNAYLDGAPCPFTPSDMDYATSVVNQPSNEAIYIGVPAMQFSILWIVEVLLQARIFAIYNSRKLAIFNAIFFLLEIGTMMFFWYFPDVMYGDLDFTDPPVVAGQDVTDCALYWIPGIAFELWLAALAIAKLRRKILKHDLLTVMVHDSIKYFLLVALVMVIHIVMAQVRYKGEHVVPFVIAGQTIGGSRMILHLRRAYFKSHDHETGISRPNISFAMGTVDNPAPKRRIVDETFYVDELIDDYSGNEEDGCDHDEDNGEQKHAVA